MLTVTVVILLFLWHAPSAAVPVLTIPIAVLISFIPFRLLGLSANIMSLGGIAIAIGALVDASIVVVEQTHKKLELWQQDGQRADYRRVVIDAVREVGAPSFFALLVIAVSFLPVLTLEAQEGRLFRPLAYTKSLSMIVAAILAITLDPALRLMFTRREAFRSGPPILRRIANAFVIGRIRPEDRSSDQPRAHARLSSRGAAGVTASGAGHRRRVRDDRRDRADLHAARVGVHAAARRRHAALHAVDGAGHLDRERAEAAADDRPHHQAVPRSGSRARQDRPRRDADRSGAALDARDARHAEAAVRVAPRSDLVFVLGAGMGGARSSGTSRPTTSRRTR